MASFAGFLLKLFCWKYFVNVDIPPKCVICVAPHTSNWDFLFGKLFYTAVGGKPHFLMKAEWFFFPLNYFLEAIGGIPVNRKRQNSSAELSLTDQMIEEFKRRDYFQLAVAPEGTRKRNTKWKSGFYFIALGAGVPIVLAHIDYTKKELGISKIIYPTGDEEADIYKIKQYYKDFKGKYPDQFAVE